MAQLTKVHSGLLATLSLAGVADGTDLHGLQGWTAYRNGGSGAGLFDIQGGEIHSNDSVVFAMALWVDPSTDNPGHVMRADVTSPNWGALVPGLCANGASDHSEDTRGLLGNTWELAERSGTGDYGEGAIIASGTTPGQPLTNNQYYPLLVASVQQPTLAHARGGIVFNNAALAFNDSSTGISTGINTGADTSPGIYYYAAAGARWKNVAVYKDYRLTVEGLTGSRAFRLYDSLGGVLASSAAQSGGQAYVNVHTLAWPITGHIQVFEDTSFTPGQEVAGKRYPEVGNAADIRGGDLYDTVVRSVGIQINWDGASWPDEWTVPSTKDVTADLVEMDLSIVAANPRIEVDTCTITLRDPDGKYVPGRTESSLYPNVRLGRALRVVLQVGTATSCPFFGYISEYSPQVGGYGGVDEQVCEIRAESPIRVLAQLGLQIDAAPSGAIVDASGTAGVVPTLLSLIPTVIPSSTWQLGVTLDSIDVGFLTPGMTIQTALEQAAIFADSLYFTRGNYKQLTDEPNYHFVWQPRDSAGTAVADHTWVDTAGDITGLNARFTGDQL